MRLLLDTHIILWALTSAHQLSDLAKTYLKDIESDLYFSSVSVMEISIKHHIHPDEMMVSGEEARRAFLAAGYIELPFTAIHAACVDDLPMHHRDPFDRMLLAQAKASGMKLLSHDERFPVYGDYVIHV